MEKVVTSDGKGGYKEVSTEQQSSIELSKNAKGDISWKVKVYTDDEDTIEEKLENYITIVEKQLEKME
jgi:uncharacterized protein with gpF-like domain